MLDAQMHDNEAFNAWRVLQRSKELDQWPKRAFSQTHGMLHSSLIKLYKEAYKTLSMANKHKGQGLHLGI